MKKRQPKWSKLKKMKLWEAPSFFFFFGSFSFFWSNSRDFLFKKNLEIRNKIINIILKKKKEKIGKENFFKTES